MPGSELARGGVRVIAIMEWMRSHTIDSISAKMYAVYVTYEIDASSRWSIEQAASYQNRTLNIKRIKIKTGERVKP